MLCKEIVFVFAMHAPLRGNGIVLTGVANPTEFDEVYTAATTPVSEEVWHDSEAAFGVRV